jgi:hypothetical protein
MNLHHGRHHRDPHGIKTRIRIGSTHCYYFLYRVVTRVKYLQRHGYAKRDALNHSLRTISIVLLYSSRLLHNIR